MNFEKLRHYLGSRLALNLYFWLFLFLLKYEDVSYIKADYSRVLYFSLLFFYMGILAAFTYLNNLVLLPRFWLKKRMWTYMAFATLLICFTSVFYVFILKVSIHLFPGLRPEHLSVITFPVDPALDLSSILREVPGYAVILLPWLIVFNLAGLYHHKTAEVKRMEAAISKHRELELAFLRNQVNPHFLFNTLNNLYALSLKKSEQTAGSILKLSAVLRYVLYDTNVDLISFSRERDIIQSYIDIELLRLESNPEHQFIISADQEYKIPPLIWLPILENLFKHTRMVENLEVDFRFTIQKHQLHVYCKNNWVKPAADQGNKPGGIGLANLKKRLDILYPGKHELSTRYDRHHFIAEVTIDLSQS